MRAPASVPAAGASRTSPLQVFISYSHEPAENAEFVRELADQLRRANLSVWLDEERVAAGQELLLSVQQAIDASDVGLFVVTRGWSRETHWIKTERQRFANRPDRRRIFLLRNDIDRDDLGLSSADNHVLLWRPDDPGTDALLWQLYCGITGREPGLRREWAEKGKRLVSGPAGAPRRRRDDPAGETAARVRLPLNGEPTSHLAGEGWTYVATEFGEWVGVAPDGTLHPPLPRLAVHSTAAIGARGELLVGMFEPMIARLRDGRWEYLPQEAPVLAFAATHEGQFAGTAAGGLARIDAVPAATVLRCRDPIVELAPFGGGLLVLGSRGMCGRVAAPTSPERALAWIDTGDLGRAVGCFEALERDQVGVHGATRVGVLDARTDALSLYQRTFDEGIARVVFLGAGTWPYALVTDQGHLVMLDAGLAGARTVRFPDDAPVRGCAGLPWNGGAAAWTQAGELYLVSAAKGVERVAGEGVRLAFPAQEEESLLHVVRWDAGGGASLERVAV